MMESEEALRYRKEWLTELLKLVHSRMGHLNEALRLTKEISEGLSRNDRVSVQMLLEMRGKEIEQLEADLRRLHIFKDQFPEEIRLEMEAILKGDLPEQEEAEAKRIAETVKNCKKILDQIILIDRQMSVRIAGEDSFYK